MLVDRLRAAYLSSGESIANLAAQLGGVLTSQGITEIFGERATPTSEQTLAILDYLKDDTMRILIDPPAAPRANARDHNSEPKTLFKRRSRLKIRAWKWLN